MSAAMTCSGLSGSKNSTHSRAKSSSTSPLCMPGCDPLTEYNGRPDNVGLVRLGVLDVGRNTVHLLVVDARRGGHPTPMGSTKASLRLAEASDHSVKLTRKGADKLVETIDEFAKIAGSSGCAELMAFATSAVRDAKNSEDVLARVRAETGVALKVLSGV